MSHLTAARSNAARCVGCRSFQASAQDVEAQLPGLRILSSAYASVRASDGLCRRHERYVTALSGCDAYEGRTESRMAFQPT